VTFQKGKSGNPAGRKKGLASHLTTELQRTVAADAMPIVRSIIAQAKAGDTESRRVFLKLLPQGKCRARCRRIGHCVGDLPYRRFDQPLFGGLRGQPCAARRSAECRRGGGGAGGRPSVAQGFIVRSGSNFGARGAASE
jgi:hypothetical protein